MTGVRWRKDEGFEGQCEDCREWWPIDVDFFTPSHGMRICRACFLERRRQRESGRSRRVIFMTPETLAKKRARDNERKRRERLDPERGDKLRERERIAQRQYFERNKDKMRAARRAYYERVVGHVPKAGIGRPRKDVAA